MFLICDFSKEMCSYVVPEDDLRIETCWNDFKCFNVKFYVSALVGIIKATLRNARCNDKDEI